MVQIPEVGLAATDRVARRGRSDREREPYLQAVRRLTADQVVELVPDAGESLRTLKRLTSRAATEVGRRIPCGVTPEGTLVVWPASIKRRARRVPAE